MTPHDLDDEFLVWPFRRQLVDETALPDERPPLAAQWNALPGPQEPGPPVPPE
ncbi:MAG: hypothetical protein ACXVZL_10360 [Gaiellaceae bacterium]